MPAPNCNSGPTPIGTALAFHFNQDDALDEHSIIEFAIDISLIDLGVGRYIDGAHGSPGCGNDRGWITPSSPIPESSAALLMCVGMLTVRIGGGLGRRKA